MRGDGEKTVAVRKETALRRKWRRKNESLQGRMGDALALGGEEGRDKLRKAAGRSKYPLIRGYPNGATRRERSRHPELWGANAGN